MTGCSEQRSNLLVAEAGPQQLDGSVENELRLSGRHPCRSNCNVPVRRIRLATQLLQEAMKLRPVQGERSYKGAICADCELKGCRFYGHI